MREVRGGKEDVGRMRFQVKDDATKSGTHHRWRLGNERWVRKKKKKIEDPSQAGLGTRKQIARALRSSCGICLTAQPKDRCVDPREAEIKKRARAPVDPGGKGHDRARFPFSYSLVVPLWFLFAKPRKRNR